MPRKTKPAPAPAPEPAPTPEPAPELVPEPVLTWPRPPLVDPVTVYLGTGSTVTRLDPTKDYIIKLPNTTKLGDTLLVGGRNVVVIGGHISTGSDVPPWNHKEHAALFINANVGIVHIEGVLIDNSNVGAGDGIQIDSPDSIVQIQNVRIVGLTGSQATNHADVVQPYGGVKELRIDRLTGSTNMQGLTIQPDLRPIGKVTLKRVDITYTNVAPGEGGKMITVAKFGTCNAVNVTLDQVYIKPKTGWALGRAVYPDIWHGTCPAQATSTEVSWPSLPSVVGSVKLGPPPEGSFVPAGSVGIGYV